MGRVAESQTKTSWLYGQNHLVDLGELKGDTKSLLIGGSYCWCAPSKSTTKQKSIRVISLQRPIIHCFIRLSTYKHLHLFTMSNINGGTRGRNAMSSVDFYRRVPKDLTEVRYNICTNIVSHCIGYAVFSFQCAISVAFSSVCTAFSSTKSTRGVIQYMTMPQQYLQLPNLHGVMLLFCTNILF